MWQRVNICGIGDTTSNDPNLTLLCLIHAEFTLIQNYQKYILMIIKHKGYGILGITGS